MPTWKAALWTLVVLGVLGALAGAAMVWGGLYNIAATAQHTELVYEVLEETMHSSVKLRARGVAVPQELDDPDLVQRGAACFRDNCVQCHGGPGVAADAIGMAMQPVPGSLIGAAQTWDAGELYWITRHGIKMSGMPAWQYHLSETELWAVVAFVQQLPELTPDAYAARVARAGECRSAQPPPAAATPDIAERGKVALRMYGCHACHTIPGITGSEPLVGPPLGGFASGALVAGRLPNTRGNVVAWIRHPLQIDPRSAMPDLGVTREHALQMAAYLATLR